MELSNAELFGRKAQNYWRSRPRYAEAFFDFLELTAESRIAEMGDRDFDPGAAPARGMGVRCGAEQWDALNFGAGHAGERALRDHRRICGAVRTPGRLGQSGDRRPGLSLV